MGGTSETTEAELWRFVPGFGGRYSVSSLGRVRNNETRRLVRIWAGPSRDGRDYLRVCLYFPGPGKRRRHFLIHRLVVAVFVFKSSDLPDDHHAHHRDRDRANNRLANLEAVPADEHLTAHGSGRDPAGLTEGF